MIRNISSVGIVLMTALVIYRASTINHTVKLDGLYQREADVSFSVENNNRLQMLELEFRSANLLALNGKIPALLFQEEVSKKIRSENFQHDENDSPLDIIEEFVAFEVLKEEESYIISSIVMDDFSLDRESTINSNLSLLFPRHRILQHPSQSDLTK